jgi:hypothetical protein
MKKKVMSLFGFKSKRPKLSSELLLTITLSGVFSFVTYNGLKHFERDLISKKPVSIPSQIDSNQKYHIYIVVSEEDTLVIEPNPSIHTNLKFYYSVNSYKLDELSTLTTDKIKKIKLAELSKEYLKKSIELF